jgi:hypothetical protein
MSTVLREEDNERLGAQAAALSRRIRILLSCFIIGLVVSGLTAFPLQAELDLLAAWLGPAGAQAPGLHRALIDWILEVRGGVDYNAIHYPFMAYGTDWLAFAHIVIAINFVGAWRDPVRNIWAFDFGLIACALVVPLALICGPLRGIPLGWRLLDCSFGLIGCVPLLVCRSWARRLETIVGSAPRTA